MEGWSLKYRLDKGTRVFRDKFQWLRSNLSFPMRFFCKYKIDSVRFNVSPWKYKVSFQWIEKTNEKSRNPQINFRIYLLRPHSHRWPLLLPAPPPIEWWSQNLLRYILLKLVVGSAVSPSINYLFLLSHSSGPLKVNKSESTINNDFKMLKKKNIKPIFPSLTKKKKKFSFQFHFFLLSIKLCFFHSIFLLCTFRNLGMWWINFHSDFFCSTSIWV